jgi:hypothetical protein
MTTKAAGSAAQLFKLGLLVSREDGVEGRFGSGLRRDFLSC